MARKRPTPEFVVPMMALAVSTPPTGVWQCEIKFDGYRALALVGAGKAELWSRNQKPLTADFPSVAQELQRLKCESAILDGEVVALDAAGHSRFQLLQGRGLAGASTNLVYYIFDLVALNGESWASRPIEERRARLEKLLTKARSPLRLSPAFNVEPAELLKVAREQQLEGIIAKRVGSRYEPGQRSGAWVKCKLSLEQEFVIGGITPPRNSRTYFGALLVGYYEDKKLLYAGKIGTGFTQALLKSLHADFQRLVTTDCPFDNLPMLHRSRFGVAMSRSEMAKVTWLKPQRVAQVKFAEWTEEGLLRQPVFLGLRRDKSPRTVRREIGPVSSS